jgi:hypothetical protein
MCLAGVGSLHLGRVDKAPAPLRRSSVWWRSGFEMRSILKCSVTAASRAVAQPQRDHVLAEQRRAARHADAPAHLPNDAADCDRCLRLAHAHAAVIVPRLRFNEAMLVEAVALCRRYSGGVKLAAGSMAARLRIALCGRLLGLRRAHPPERQRVKSRAVATDTTTRTRVPAMSTHMPITH